MALSFIRHTVLFLLFSRVIFSSSSVNGVCVCSMATLWSRIRQFIYACHTA